MPELALELLWSVGGPLALAGLLVLAAMHLATRQPKPPDPHEHEGATEDWSPTGEYASLRPLDSDEAAVHDELVAIGRRLSTDLEWVQATAEQWLGDRDPGDELAYLGLSDTCGYRRDPITGEWMLVPIGGQR